MAVVDPILKQGSGAAPGGFQLENLALEVVSQSSDERDATPALGGGRRPPLRATPNLPL